MERKFLYIKGKTFRVQIKKMVQRCSQINSCDCSDSRKSERYMVDKVSDRRKQILVKYEFQLKFSEKKIKNMLIGSPCRKLKA